MLHVEGYWNQHTLADRYTSRQQKPDDVRLVQQKAGKWMNT
jgi:hypothetical protein